MVKLFLRLMSFY